MPSRKHRHPLERAVRLPPGDKSIFDVPQVKMHLREFAKNMSDVEFRELNREGKVVNTIPAGTDYSTADPRALVMYAIQFAARIVQPGRLATDQLALAMWVVQNFAEMGGVILQHEPEEAYRQLVHGFRGLQCEFMSISEQDLPADIARGWSERRMEYLQRGPKASGGSNPRSAH